MSNIFITVTGIYMTHNEKTKYLFIEGLKAVRLIKLILISIKDINLEVIKWKLL